MLVTGGACQGQASDGESEEEMGAGEAGGSLAWEGISSVPRAETEWKLLRVQTAVLLVRFVHSEATCSENQRAS